MNGFFDSNICYGPKCISLPGITGKPDQVILLMKQCGIGKALVMSTLQSEYHPAYANQRLIAETSSHGALYPVWALLPHHTGEFPRPAELLKQLKDNNVRAVKIFPSIRFHNFTVDEFCCGELFDMLEEAKLPLLIDLDQLSWQQLDEISSRHEKLRILLMNLNYSIDRVLYAFLEKHNNIYIESSGYKQYRGIEFFTRKFGASRMVFGSGLPYASGEAAISMILYADIDEADKRSIAEQNLQRMLNEVHW